MKVEIRIIGCLLWIYWVLARVPSLGTNHIHWKITWRWLRNLWLILSVDHSMGCIDTLVLASKYLSSVKSIILVAPPCPLASKEDISVNALNIMAKRWFYGLLWICRGETLSRRTWPGKAAAMRLWYRVVRQFFRTTYKLLVLSKMQCPYCIQKFSSLSPSTLIKDKFLHSLSFDRMFWLKLYMFKECYCM